ncbi:MAG: undecaprenyl-diphosphate phosphatase [Nanoarchaeota archaeon]|nr:undecaprenyl-diphosphate phosphatase [Nanoarchaeota archaeon]
MELTLFQQVILGIVQGLTEWLPISSSGFGALIMANIFGITDANFIIRELLFLHLGTFFAALVYFFTDVKKLTISFFHYKKASLKTKKTLNFIIVGTIISGILGYVLIKFLENSNLELTGKSITFVIAILLLFTGVIQLKPSRKGRKREEHLKKKDSVILGISQGLAVIPGISRSGITVSALLLRKFDDTTALRLSFLLALPVILIGNIFLNVNDMTITMYSIFGLFASFFIGFLTIHALMKLSRRINFAWFVIVFGLLMVIGILI